MKVTCDQCKKEFERTERKIRIYKTHFCSRKCHTDYVKQHSTYTEEKCSHCGESVFRNNGQKKNSKTGIYFCGKLCQNRYLAKKSKLHINPFSHQRRKKRVLEKANYTCQKCGYNKDKKMLDIHHADKNHHNNAWDNLRCICSWCHTKHHRNVEEIIGLLSLFESTIEQEKIFTKENKRYRIPDGPKKSELNPNWRNSIRPNQRKVERPSKEELEKLVWEKSTEKIAKDLGVSGVAIAKWCKIYGITKPPRGYWAKRYAGK